MVVLYISPEVKYIEIKYVDIQYDMYCIKYKIKYVLFVWNKYAFKEFF